MKKQVERLIFIHINNAARFKSSLRIYLPFITSTETLVSPAVLQPLAFVNLAFSQTGLTALGITDNLNDTHFASGMFSDAPNLGDDTSEWISPFAGTNVHAVIVLGSDQVRLVIEKIRQCLNNLNNVQTAILDLFQSTLSLTFGSSITILNTLTGQVRPGNQAGHERKQPVLRHI
jgi:hypothetical protein